MILFVDIGNTRVKWATQVDGRRSPQRAAEYAQWSAADWQRELFDGPPVERVLAATVAGGDRRLALEAAARVSGRMLAGLAEFSRSGCASFAGDWAAFDSLRDAPVTVLRHDGQLEGVARGADAEGALRVEIPGGVIERVHAGDVSLRRSLQARARVE